VPTADRTSALVVIDVQESALPGCFDIGGVLARVNGLLGRARDSGCAVVFVQHEDPGDPLMTVGSPGWQLSAKLDRLGGDTVVPKRYRDSFAVTGLNDVLAGLGAQRLVLCGVHSDYCVVTTAMSALQHGYDVTLVSDAHTALPAELPSGTIPARMVVELVNARFATLRVPDRTIEVVPAELVEL
jgi:nicotinamidase-related amidase